MFPYIELDDGTGKLWFTRQKYSVVLPVPEKL